MLTLFPIASLTIVAGLYVAYRHEREARILAERNFERALDRIQVERDRRTVANRLGHSPASERAMSRLDEFYTGAESRLAVAEEIWKAEEAARRARSN